MAKGFILKSFISTAFSSFDCVLEFPLGGFTNFLPEGQVYQSPHGIRVTEFFSKSPDDPIERSWLRIFALAFELQSRFSYNFPR